MSTAAFAQRDNSGHSSPPAHNDPPKSNNSAPANYVPRANAPVQTPTHNDGARANNNAPVNYVPRSNNSGQAPVHNNNTHSTEHRDGGYVPRATDTSRPVQQESNASTQRGPGNWVPRANPIITGSYHRPDPQQGGQGQNQGQGQGQDSRRGNQGGQDRGHDQSGRDHNPDYHGHGTDDRDHDGTRDSHPHWTSPPVMTVSQFRQEQLREIRDARTVYGEHARRGYWSYDWDHDGRNHFRYPFYVFDPYDSFGLISPWYYYPTLPGYINPYRCTIISAGLLPPIFVGLEYSCWHNNAAYQQGYDQGYQDAQAAAQLNAQQQQDSQLPDNRILDGAIDDIVSVFLHDDQRSLDRLIGDNGNVNIYVDGRYSYSLTTNDFYDLIHDNAHTTQTVDYKILDVRVEGDEAKVMALHTFKDPWGDTEKVYHTYVLKLGRRSAQIIEYGTSATKPW